MHLSLFYRHILSLDDTGLTYRRLHYPWSAIRMIELWQQQWPGWGYVSDIKLLPRASIHLPGGKHILLRGDVLVKRNLPLKPGFYSAFDELVSVLKAQRADQISKRKE